MRSCLFALTVLVALAPACAAAAEQHGNSLFQDFFVQCLARYNAAFATKQGLMRTCMHEAELLQAEQLRRLREQTRMNKLRNAR